MHRANAARLVRANLQDTVLEAMFTAGWFEEGGPYADNHPARTMRDLSSAQSQMLDTWYAQGMGPAKDALDRDAEQFNAARVDYRR